MANAKIDDHGMEHKAQVVERELLGEKLPLVTVVYNHQRNRIASVWADGKRLDKVVSVDVAHALVGPQVVTIKMYAELKTEVKDG